MSLKIPLNHLNTFYFAAKHCSFQDAARDLFVSASAVSHQIRHLEARLGYPLFKRLDKALTLTKAGETLFADIKLSIEGLHNASHKALRKGSEDTLSISVAPIFATAWLLPRLRDFYQRHPDINLQVIASFDLVDFDKDPFDAAIRLGPSQSSSPLSTSLFDAQYVVVCHPSFFEKQPLASTPTALTPANLLACPLVQNTAMKSLWARWFASAGIKHDTKNTMALEVPSTAQVIDALQSGTYLGVVDKQFIIKDLELGRLALACDHVYRSDYQYSLLVAESAHEQAHFQQFATWIRSQVTDAT